MVRLANIQRRAEKLQDFCMETFQLLMPTTVIRGGQHSIAQTEQALKQTEQTVFLTRLAAVCLPLSPTTGMFRMNLHEINEATPRA